MGTWYLHHDGSSGGGDSFPWRVRRVRRARSCLPRHGEAGQPFSPLQGGEWRDLWKTAFYHGGPSRILTSPACCIPGTYSVFGGEGKKKTVRHFLFYRTHQNFKSSVVGPMPTAFDWLLPFLSIMVSSARYINDIFLKHFHPALIFYLMYLCP